MLFLFLFVFQFSAIYVVRIIDFVVVRFFARWFVCPFFAPGQYAGGHVVPVQPAPLVALVAPAAPFVDAGAPLPPPASPPPSVSVAALFAVPLPPPPPLPPQRGVGGESTLDEAEADEVVVVVALADGTVVGESIVCNDDAPVAAEVEVSAEIAVDA